jgi:hypothetical protein
MVSSVRQNSPPSPRPVSGSEAYSAVAEDETLLRIAVTRDGKMLAVKLPLRSKSPTPQQHAAVSNMLTLPQLKAV